MTGAGHNREASDSYRGEVHRHGDWRLIVCRVGAQWILQRRRPAESAWDAVHFCRSSEAVLRLWQRETGDDGRALLALLPEHITDLRQAACGASVGHAV